MRYDILNQGMFNNSRKAKVIEYVLVLMGVFLIPIVIPYVINTTINPQYIIGTIVNTALIIAGINIKGRRKIIALITLPSLYTMTTGLLFPTALITLYMIPFIWLGNFAIIYLYRFLFVYKKFNYLKASILSVIVKASIIYIGCNLLILLLGIDFQSKMATTLITAMGLNQVITASLGSLFAFGIINIIYKKEK